MPRLRLRLRRRSLRGAEHACDEGWRSFWLAQPDPFYQAISAFRDLLGPGNPDPTLSLLWAEQLTIAEMPLAEWTRRLRVGEVRAIPALTLEDMVGWLSHPSPDVREAVQLHVLPGLEPAAAPEEGA